MLTFNQSIKACLDQAPWRQVTDSLENLNSNNKKNKNGGVLPGGAVTGVSGGDWILARCLGLLGIPLTHAPGLHPMDMGTDDFQWDDGGSGASGGGGGGGGGVGAAVETIRDVFERHPIAPFLSLHRPSRVFSPHTRLGGAASFFRAMFHDPINFCSFVVCEVRAKNQSYTAAVVSLPA